MRNKYFITGGGTGGHIYPAIAVANFLAKENIVYYVGNPNNMEYKIAKDYPFLPINIHGMPRKLSPKLFIWVLQLIWAIIKSMYYILKYKPDFAIAMSFWVNPYDWLTVNDALVADELEKTGIRTVCNSVETGLICFDKYSPKPTPILLYFAA